MNTRMKDDKLRSKDFFNAKDDPYFTFHSTKIVQTGPLIFDLPGTFTVRGVSKPETLAFTGCGTKGSGVGEIKGTVAFDRKEFGMNSGIPFIKIADRVEVNVDLKVKRVGGPPFGFQAIGQHKESKTTNSGCDACSGCLNIVWSRNPARL